MDPQDQLAEQFEVHRGHLHAVAYRMLGSLTEADDAVQEAWIRHSRAAAGDVGNLRGWLTTVVARICLDMLRSRRSRREEPLEGRIPDPIITADDGTDPEEQAVLADSVGLALLIVLETLAPAERLAFVLHDMFSLPYEEIAPIVGRTATAARQLASRGRRRVQGGTADTVTDLRRHREVLDAFQAASQSGNFEALLAVLDPDVVVRVDFGAGRRRGVQVTRGAREVAAQALTYSGLGRVGRRVLVNGTPGGVAIRGGRPVAVLAFTVSRGRVVEIDILADPVRLARLDLAAIDS